MRQMLPTVLTFAGWLVGAGILNAAEPAPVPALPDARLGIPTAPILLLTRADVCQDIGLSPQQVAAAGAAAADFQARANALGRKTDEGTRAARRSLMQAAQAWFEANLSPEQRKRLAQIDLQWEGPSALVGRPVVTQALGLTAEQKKAIEAAVVEREQARAVRPTSHADDKTLAVKALGILSPEQRERWHAMMGNHFEPRLAVTPDPNAARR